MGFISDKGPNVLSPLVIESLLAIHPGGEPKALLLKKLGTLPQVFVPRREDDLKSCDIPLKRLSLPIKFG